MPYDGFSVSEGGTAWPNWGGTEWASLDTNSRSQVSSFGSYHQNLRFLGLGSTHPLALQPFFTALAPCSSAARNDVTTRHAVKRTLASRSQRRMTILVVL
ncbi:MAG: hypothetical protein ACI87O_001622 [Planctomycetota bacterium]|jgi:hypothetical protein